MQISSIWKTPGLIKSGIPCLKIKGKVSFIGFKLPDKRCIKRKTFWWMHLILAGEGGVGVGVGLLGLTSLIRQDISTPFVYGHSFSPPILSVQLYIYMKQFEERWSCLTGSGISSAEIFSTFFFGRLLKIWLIEQQLGEKLRKLIQDGETYDNVSYYAWVFFKPIVYLGNKTAIDRRFSSDLLEPIWSIQNC